MKKNKRSKFLIYPEIQMPLVYIGITLVLIVTLVQFLTLIVFIYKYRYGDVGFYPEGIKDVLFNIFYYRAGLLLILLVPLAITVFFFTRYFLFISNKYAGPVYKIEKALDQIIATGEYQPVSVRSTDFLIPFVEKLNSSFETLRKKKS